MIQLHQLPTLVNRRKKRVGRGLGSGSGAKSGRGTTRHQSAREKIPLSFEGGQNRLVKKFPLLRGKGKNRSLQEKPLIINVSVLENIPQEKEVTIKTLLKYHIIRKRDMNSPVKISGFGNLKKALTIKLPVSHTALKKIKKAEGKVIPL